jgi:hypothetical protein
VKSGRLRAARLRAIWAGVLALVAVLALTIGVGAASAASPVLEFQSSVSAFPIDFTAEGGEVTAVLSNFDTVVHCAASRGEGTITGPRSALSSYAFTGCTTEGGEDSGARCKSEGAEENEIRTPTIEAELVFIDQARHEVGVLLAPGGGIYMEFECGGESVKALGPFLAPVGPINQERASFTASLYRFGPVQFPDEYETAGGERRQAIPTAEREDHLPGTTGVELSFAIHTGVPLTVRAISAAEVEARQREEEAAAKKRHDDEEAAKKHAEEEAAKKKLQEAETTKRQEEEKARAQQRARRMSKALKQCRKGHSKQKRARCERRVKHRFATQKTAAKP